MKKFTKILENKDLSYTDFFGKKVSHQKSLMDSVSGYISEKDFNNYDIITNFLKENIDNQIIDKSLELHNVGKRIRYISELIYDEYLKNKTIGIKFKK